MKSNYIITHRVYTLIKAVDAITLLVIHHSTEITIAVNFTSSFLDLPWRVKLAACLLQQGASGNWEDLTVGRLYSGKTHEVGRPYSSCSTPQLLLQLSACKEGLPWPHSYTQWWDVLLQGLSVLSWDGLKTSPLKVPLITALIVHPREHVLFNIWS